MTVDHIPEQDIAARAAAEVAAQSGHDLFMWNGAGGPHLYRKYLVDMTSLVELVEKKYGKASIIGRQIAYNQDSKTGRHIPTTTSTIRHVPQGLLGRDRDDPGNLGRCAYRWRQTEGQGPSGRMSLARSNDPNLCWRGVLWSYGASVQDKTGEQVVLDSKAAVEAVKFVAALYKEAMTGDVLSWNDASNNHISILASAPSSSTRSLPIGRRSSSTKKSPTTSLS